MNDVTATNALPAALGSPWRGRPMPRLPVPALRVPLLGGGAWDLAERRPERFTMVVFYRGFHCPVCTTYIRELDRLVADFAARGIEVVAISSDSEARAALTKEKWGLGTVPVAYGLPIPTAREWGLYISTSRGKSSSGVDEPPVFSEPGIFVIRPDRTLYWATTSTMPFARPHFSEMLQAFDFVQRLDYPARGELPA